MGSVLKFSQISSQYAARRSDWRAFLDCWSALDRGLRAGVRRIGDTNKQRIPKKRIEPDVLPPSYRDFLNAGGASHRLDVGRAWREEGGGWFRLAEDMEIFADYDQQHWKVWVDLAREEVADNIYYRYGYRDSHEGLQDPLLIRNKDLANLYVVNDFGSEGIVMLNSNEISVDGEWEAWVASTKYGVQRFRSFAELMQNLHAEFALDDLTITGPYDKATLDRSCARHLQTAATA